jgi:hypothetical protein
MLRRPLAALALVAAFPLADTMAAARQAPRRIIHFSAFDDKGRAVTDLQPADLAVRAGGKPLEVIRVEPAQTPLRVSVIVSDAGTGGFQQAVATFIQMVRERAEIELISLLTQPEVITNFSSDPAVLREGVRRLGVRGRQHGAQLMEAIQDATKGVVAEGRRPVILVLRVGVEGTTPLVGSEVRERLRRSGALLYVVSTASAQRPPPTSARQGISAEQAQLQDDEVALSRRNLAEVLGDGARESGGRHDEIVSTTSVSPAVGRIADDLLNQYAVTCALPPGVKVNDKLSIASARRGVKIQAPARLK